MSADSLISFMKNNKGKTIGIVVGFLFGVLILCGWFWYSLFLLVCVIAGYYLGGLHDKGGRLAAFFDKILLKRLK